MQTKFELQMFQFSMRDLSGLHVDNLESQFHFVYQ
jgi:hypothetical protein